MPLRAEGIEPSIPDTRQQVGSLPCMPFHHARTVLLVLGPGGIRTHSLRLRHSGADPFSFGAVSTQWPGWWSQHQPGHSSIFLIRLPGCCKQPGPSKFSGFAGRSKLPGVRCDLAITLETEGIAYSASPKPPVLSIRGKAYGDGGWASPWPTCSSVPLAVIYGQFRLRSSAAYG
jgi:hypothetical protein